MGSAGGLIGSAVGGLANTVGGMGTNLGGFLSGQGTSMRAPTMQAPLTAEQAQAAQAQAQEAIKQQQAFAQAVAAQGGLGNQAAVFQQQQDLAGQLANQAAGGGPNPAQAQLAQNTAQNVAQQSALMGSQRGTSANPGLLARQAAMQGAGIQQQAAGQAATLGAQQQLAAQQALMQQQNALQGVAANQIGNQAQQQNQYGQMAQGQQNALYNQINAQNQAQTGAANVGAGIEQTNLHERDALAGGLMNAGAAFLTKKAHGGMIDQPKSKIVHYLSNGGVVANMKEGGAVSGQAKVAGDSLKNDTQKALLSPGEIVIPRSITMHPNAATLAAKFVAQELAKHKGKK